MKIKLFFAFLLEKFKGIVTERKLKKIRSKNFLTFNDIKFLSGIDITSEPDNDENLIYTCYVLNHKTKVRGIKFSEI